MAPVAGIMQHQWRNSGTSSCNSSRAASPKVAPRTWETHTHTRTYTCARTHTHTRTHACTHARAHARDVPSAARPPECGLVRSSSSGRQSCAAAAAQCWTAPRPRPPVRPRRTGRRKRDRRRQPAARAAFAQAGAPPARPGSAPPPLLLPQPPLRALPPQRVRRRVRRPRQAQLLPGRYSSCREGWPGRRFLPGWQAWRVVCRPKGGGRRAQGRGEWRRVHACEVSCGAAEVGATAALVPKGQGELTGQCAT